MKTHTVGKQPNAARSLFNNFKKQLFLLIRKLIIVKDSKGHVRKVYSKVSTLTGSTGNIWSQHANSFPSKTGP